MWCGVQGGVYVLVDCNNWPSHICHIKIVWMPQKGLHHHHHHSMLPWRVCVVLLFSQKFAACHISSEWRCYTRAKVDADLHILAYFHLTSPAIGSHLQCITTASTNHSHCFPYSRIRIFILLQGVVFFSAIISPPSCSRDLLCNANEMIY